MPKRQKIKITKKPSPKHVLDKNLIIQLKYMSPLEIRDWLDEKVDKKITTIDVSHFPKVSVLLTRIDSELTKHLAKKQSIISATSTPKTSIEAKTTSMGKRGNIQSDRDLDPPKTKARKVTRTKLSENGENNLPKQKPMAASTETRSAAQARNELTERMVKWATSSNYGQNNTAMVLVSATDTRTDTDVVAGTTDSVTTSLVTTDTTGIAAGPTVVITDTGIAAGTALIAGADAVSETDTDVVTDTDVGMDAEVVTDSCDVPATAVATDLAGTSATPARSNYQDQEPVPADDDPLLRCTYCYRYFTQPRFLRMHEDTHGQRSSPRPAIIPLPWREA